MNWRILWYLTSYNTQVFLSFSKRIISLYSEMIWTDYFRILSYSWSSPHLIRRYKTSSLG